MALQHYQGQFGAGGGIGANLPDLYGMQHWRPNVFVGDEALDRELSQQRQRFLDRDDRLAEFDPPAMDLPLVNEPLMNQPSLSVSGPSEAALLGTSRCYATYC